MIWRARPTGRTIVVILSVALVSGFAACGRAVKPQELVAPVPEAPRRMVYRLDSADHNAPADLSVRLKQALDQAVCLLRSERADECQETEPDVPICNTRSVREIQAAVQPALHAIPQVRLTSSSSINAELAALIPGTVSTTNVRDARRDHLCGEWRSSDGACVAWRVDKAWILLHAPAGGDGRVDRFEVFLAERVCAAKPR